MLVANGNTTNAAITGSGAIRCDGRIGLASRVRKVSMCRPALAPIGSCMRFELLSNSAKPGRLTRWSLSLPVTKSGERNGYICQELQTCHPSFLLNASAMLRELDSGRPATVKAASLPTPLVHPTLVGIRSGGRLYKIIYVKYNLFIKR